VDGEEHRPHAPPPWPCQGRAAACVSPGAAVVVEALLGEGLARPVAGSGDCWFSWGRADLRGLLVEPRFSGPAGGPLCPCSYGEEVVRVVS